MSNEKDTPELSEEGYSHLPDFAALTIPEVCKITKISRGTFYNEVARGNLVISKIGTRTLVLMSDLREYMQSRQLPRRVPRAVAGGAA